MKLIYDEDDRSAGFKKGKVNGSGKVTVTLAPAGGAVLVGSL